MRGLSDVVLTGIGTVEADNPLMTDRRKNAVRQPVRAVLDSSLKIDINANIVNSAEYAPVIIYTSENADSSKIMQLNDKNVKVILNDGTIVTGYVYTFTRSVDSDSGIASLSLESSDGYIEIMQNDVKKITITP